MSPEQTTRPDLLVLDVNETLSDLSALAPAFAEVGLGEHELQPWFAGVLRDGFALTLLGENPPFADLAVDALRARAEAAGLDDPAAAASHVMERLVRLPPHPDVVPGLLALADLGCRIVTLSNGSAAVARALLEDTPAGAVVEQYLSVSDAGGWKPATHAYRHALTATGVPAERAILVAVHPWDLEGARRAGLRTAWIRRGTTWPTHFTAPEVVVDDVVHLAGIWS